MAYVVNAAHVKYLREISGCGLIDAHRALELCDGDMLLAEGYLRNIGLAVCVRSQTPDKTDQEAYMDWVWSRARAFKQAALDGTWPVPIPPKNQ